MGDTDLIAQVYPLPGRHFDTVQQAIQSNPQCKPPKCTRPEPESSYESRSTRESTELPEEFDPDYYHTLELRFSYTPKSSTGLIFGKDKDACDVILPSHISGISKRHFALTYKTFEDGRPRLLIRDLGSRIGSSVAYDKAKTPRRRGFDWILDGYEYPNKCTSFTIELFEDFEFMFIVCHQAINSPAYIHNVQEFSHGTLDAGDLLSNTKIDQGPDTEGQTPGYGSTLMPSKMIACGAQGDVQLCWDVSSGAEYACKYPRGPSMRSNWEKEATIMRSVTHEHIVQLCFSDFRDELPKLFLEYMPLGDVQQANEVNPFSQEECIVMLLQSSSALAYLHETLKVAHRDVKPENILVKQRDQRRPKNLLVKLSDFGLSKTSDELLSRVGTTRYMAPEVLKEQKYYTEAVDIWSLGVLILQLTNPLSHSQIEPSLHWCDRIASTVRRSPPHGLVAILQRMLVIQPEKRCSAAECFLETQKLFKLRLDNGELSSAPMQEAIVDLGNAGQQQELQTQSPQGQRGRQPPRAPLEQYEVLNWNDCLVTWTPGSAAVNVTQLMKIFEVSQARLTTYLKNHPDIKPREHTLRDSARGKYMSLGDTARLFLHFNLKRELADSVARLIDWMQTEHQLIQQGLR
ncbi:kinase-like domain-containing protein [Xylaria arbuscula]|nr:kinase-like domain-containing protein [Xylaria arbuscula]